MKLFLIFLIELLSVFSVENQFVNEDNIDNKLSLIAGTSHKNWKVSAFSIDNDLTNCNSSSAVIQDDIYTFYTDGTYNYNAGELLFLSGDECETDDSAVGSWTFNERQDSIVVEINNLQYTYGLKVLTADSLLITSSSGLWFAFVPK